MLILFLWEALQLIKIAVSFECFFCTLPPTTHILDFKFTYVFWKFPGQYNPGKYGDAPAPGGFQQNQYRAQASAGFRQNYNKY